MEVMGFKKTDNQESMLLKEKYKYYDLLEMVREVGCVDRAFDTTAEAARFVNNLRTSAIGRYNRQHRHDGFRICARRHANRIFVYKEDIDG